MAENEREKIPKYRILGVDIAATNMEQVLRLLAKEGRKLSGEYICVSNVHTTVMSYDNPQYCAIQNNAFLALPDGKPLSILCRKKGFCEAGRVTGPDLMLELLKMSAAEGYRHYFYGGSQETLDKMQKRLQAEFPQAIIAGMYSPPFRQLRLIVQSRILSGWDLGLPSRRSGWRNIKERPPA